MRNKTFKRRCEKRKLSKNVGICRTYDPIQYAYADVLEANDEIAEIRVNVPMDGLVIDGKEYVSDFVCVRTDGILMVRECVFKEHLGKPLTVKLLDASREYWTRKGIRDWGIVIDETSEER